MQVRMATTGEIMVNVILGYEHKEMRIKLLNGLLQQFPGITTLLYTVNTKLNDSLYDLEPVTYHGKGYIIEKLEDFSFKISPKSFFKPTRNKQKNCTV